MPGESHRSGIDSPRSAGQESVEVVSWLCRRWALVSGEDSVQPRLPKGLWPLDVPLRSPSGALARCSHGVNLVVLGYIPEEG